MWDLLEVRELLGQTVYIQICDWRSRSLMLEKPHEEVYRVELSTSQMAKSNSTVRGIVQTLIKSRMGSLLRLWWSQTSDWAENATDGNAGKMVQFQSSPCMYSSFASYTPQNTQRGRDTLLVPMREGEAAGWGSSEGNRVKVKPGRIKSWEGW